MSDRPPSSETPPSGYARIMTVFGAILNDSPAGLERTMQLTGLPRSATWRCLTTFEAEGWLCQRLSDGAFRLTASACAGYERAHQTHPLAEALVPFLRQLSKSGRLSIDLVAVAAPRRLIQIETNRSDPCITGRLFLRPSFDRSLDRPACRNPPHACQSGTGPRHATRSE